MHKRGIYLYVAARQRNEASTRSTVKLQNNIKLMTIEKSRDEL